MANQNTKVEQIAWEETCEAFSSMNTLIANADIYKPNAGFAELAGQTIRVPYANQIDSSTGLDVSSSISDVADLTVPISLSKSDIKNGTFSLDVTESNVERRVKDNVLAAVRKISSGFNTDITNAIIDRGALVGAETVALTDYKHFAKADAMLDEVEADKQSQFMYLDPRTKLGVANELGMRQTDNNRDMSAYSMGELPSIGSFRTYGTNSMKAVAGSAVTGLTVDGGSQGSAPIAYNSDGGYSAGQVDDIRFQTLTVSANTLVNGDCFVIAGLNRVGIDSKVDTQQLMTYRVISGGGTTTPVISPAIIAAGPYQNVTAAPANGAAITLINTDTIAPTVFTTKDAVRFFCSDINWGALEGSAEVIETYTTEYGLTVAMLRQGNALTGKVNYRLSAWGKANVVDSLKCGIILPNQNVAI